MKISLSTPQKGGVRYSIFKEYSGKTIKKGGQMSNAKCRNTVSPLESKDREGKGVVIRILIVSLWKCRQGVPFIIFSQI